MFDRKIITTADGSHTLHLENVNEHFHSIHGAVQEAYHVFIKNGLDAINKKQIDILEIGFGTGLNALITFYEAQKQKKIIDYTGIEAFPINKQEFEILNYCHFIAEDNCQNVFNKIFDADWNSKIRISEHYTLHKVEQLFENFSAKNQFDLIYFDAFGPRVQPDLWTEKIFFNMLQALKDGGFLVTYSAKGNVRRAMQSVGFTVEKLPGPPRKREMLRGQKQ